MYCGQSPLLRSNLERIKGETGRDKKGSDLLSVLTQPWPGLLVHDAKLLLAEARLNLHAELVGALRSMAPDAPAATLDGASEAAFIRYAKKLLLAVAARAPATDVESCLEQLRAELIPLIIAAIEPDRRINKWSTTRA